MIKNFQSELDRFEGENKMMLSGSKDTVVHHFMKRSTIWDDIFGFMMNATGSRKPRKVEDSVKGNKFLEKSPRGT